MQLLERFLTQADAGAFKCGGRHCPMVRECLSGHVLPRPATPRTPSRPLSWSWSRRVARSGDQRLWAAGCTRPAHRVAIQASSAAARGAPTKRQAGQLAVATSTNEPPGLDDLLPVLHEEIARLPARERLALVLCDLEGMTPAAGRRALHGANERSETVWPRNDAGSRSDWPDAAWHDERYAGALFVRRGSLSRSHGLGTNSNGQLARPGHRQSYRRRRGGLGHSPHTDAGGARDDLVSRTSEAASAALLAVGAGGFAVATLVLYSNPEPRPLITAARRASRPNRSLKMELARTTEEDRKPVPIAAACSTPMASHCQRDDLRST